MKKIFKNKVFLIIILCMISCGIGVYGANTYNSNSVLYTTSDGESMSVNEALNDLYDNKCSSETEEYVFDYTGGEQTFTVPKTGTYKLEVWGAQGGTVDGLNGGYGAYSIGSIKLTKEQILYINIGGSGSGSYGCGNLSYLNGGYNGGGKGTSGGESGRGNCVGGGSGGGATHIALKSGLLSTLSKSISDILIVAGGGGGSAKNSYNNGQFSFGGGSAGGISGNSGTGEAGTCAVGTQTSGYTFGLGSNYTSSTYGASGGGGGFYGGYGNGYNSAGCGGSSYIGNSLLINKSMYCYNCMTSNVESTKTVSITCASSVANENCSKQGNGYAKITYLRK